MVQRQIIAFNYFIRLDYFSWNSIDVNVCIRNQLKNLKYVTRNTATRLG